MLFKSRSAYDWLVVGLGNPGLQYESTRHNAGFMALECLAEKNGFSFNKHKYDAAIGEYRLGKLRVLAVKPQTYMNNSGSAVAKIAAFYKIPSEQILVLQDDVSLDVGRIRIRRKGSDGGQKGVRDIIELLGTDNIARIKIGVGQKPSANTDLASWVLGRFPKADEKPLGEALKRAALSVDEIMLKGIDSAMNKFNN